MRAIGLLLAASLSNFPAQARDAAVDVTFKDSGRFADAAFRRPQSEKNLAVVEQAVRRMFSEVAAPFLAPGHTISVEVSEIDLAGRFAPMSLNGIRILDSVGWPRLQFSYSVRDADGKVSSGAAKLSDPGYLDSFNRHLDSDRLRYERQMLSDWFRRTFPRSGT